MSTEKVRATSNQIRAARELLGLSQQQLADAAGLTRTTVSAFESSRRPPYDSTRAALQEALERRGVVFTNGDRPGLYLDKSKADIPV